MPAEETDTAAEKAAPVVIKKYANRRLYDTESSSYITLEHLSAMTREGREFRVLDAKSGKDITHSILTQIVVEKESHGAAMLPVSFLRQIISMYGDQMQGMVPHYLAASMEAFQRNQEQMRAAFAEMLPTAASNPFEAMTRQNMAMMRAAADMWTNAGPFAAFGLRSDKAHGRAKEEPGDRESVESLRQEVAELKAKLDKLTDK